MVIENNTQVLRLFKTLLLEGKWTEEIMEKILYLCLQWIIQ